MFYFGIFLRKKASFRLFQRIERYDDGSFGPVTAKRYDLIASSDVFSPVSLNDIRDLLDIVRIHFPIVYLFNDDDENYFFQVNALLFLLSQF